MFRTVLPCLLILMCANHARAQGLIPPQGPVKASLIADVDAIVPGESFTIGLRFKIKPHWHTYWVNPGDVGTATSITFKNSNFKFGAIQWPLPKVLDFKGDVSYGYENEVVHVIPVQVPNDLQGAQHVTLEANAEWLMCKTECVPGSAPLRLTLPVKKESNPAHANVFAEWRQRLPILGGQKIAHQWITSVTQSKDKNASIKHELIVQWNKTRSPQQLQWLPIATDAVAIEDVSLNTTKGTTRIQFKAKIYKPKQVPGGILNGLLMFEDNQGKPLGILTSAIILPQTPEKAKKP